MRSRFIRACLLLCTTLALLAVPAADAQSPPTRLNSRGPVTNAAGGIVLAEITDISAGPHTFQIIASATFVTSIVVEWRTKDNRTVKWMQGLIVPVNSTLVVPINEEQTFEEGDRLQLMIYSGSVGTVWGSLSLK